MPLLYSKNDQIPNGISLRKQRERLALLKSNISAAQQEMKQLKGCL